MLNMSNTTFIDKGTSSKVKINLDGTHNEVGHADLAIINMSSDIIGTATIDIIANGAEDDFSSQVTFKVFDLEGNLEFMANNSNHGISEFIHEVSNFICKDEGTTSKILDEVSIRIAASAQYE